MQTILKRVNLWRLAFVQRHDVSVAAVKKYSYIEMLCLICSKYKGTQYYDLLLLVNFLTSKKISCFEKKFKNYKKP